MPSVTIDAGVLAVPLLEIGADAIHHYIDTILDWRRLLDEPWVAIYMSERAPETLLEEGLYPFRDQLKGLFAVHGIEEYDVNTLAQVVDRLLQQTPSFETYFKVREVLADQVSTTPDIMQLCAGELLQSDLARCVVLIAILRRHCREPVSDHSLILRQAPRQVVTVRALVHDLEHYRDDLHDIPISPEVFEGDVLVCDDFMGLIECLDESAILLKATDEVGIETSIRIAVYKARLARSAAPEWDDIPRHRIGKEFRSSFQRIHTTLELAARLLRAIVETLEQTNMPATHWLRTRPGGNDPQRVRKIDQAKAWRRDIDRDHHLHYWSCEDGIVELASMSFPHNDFTIPE
jgi:hypothetical protein